MGGGSGEGGGTGVRVGWGGAREDVNGEVNFLENKKKKLGGGKLGVSGRGRVGGVRVDVNG